MKSNGTYVPHGLVKQTTVFFHLDNVDWQEDTPDGKHTSHYLLLAVFQRKVKENCPIALPTLCQNQSSATLDDNEFNDLLPYSKPSISKFQRSPGSTDAQLPASTIDSEQNFTPWLSFRSYEHMLVKDDEQNNDEGDHVLLKNKVNDISELKLPSFAATNSLVLKIDTTLTNIFSTPLVPGPASSYSAIYTALMRAQNVLTWSCGDSSKVVVSLDLDLYEKAYM